MNLNKKIPAAIALASCLLLPSCDFNEDFCTRYGELIAYCDWENITEKAPLPPLRHVIPFQGNASIQEAKTFTQDTLRWQLPRGDYRFVFYTGDYQVSATCLFPQTRSTAKPISQLCRNTAAHRHSTKSWSTRKAGHTKSRLGIS